MIPRLNNKLDNGLEVAIYRSADLKQVDDLIEHVGLEGKVLFWGDLRVVLEEGLLQDDEKLVFVLGLLEFGD